MKTFLTTRMEIRKDYFLERYVYLAKDRKKRPKEFKKIENIDEGICYFCPGNERLTPPEIGRIGTKDKWSIRWFPNKFAAVELKGQPEFRSKTFYKHANAYGKHEIIAETSNHKHQIWDLSEKQIKQLLYVYKNRINSLSKLKNIKYVLIFKNHGRQGGTSLIHSHSQVTALSKIPTEVVEKIESIKKYKGCAYCKVIDSEKKSKRKCFENKTFVAFIPYAPRFNYEIWIFPKRHVRKIEDLSDEEYSDWASILKKVLVKLKKLGASFNYYIHYSPDKSELHLQMCICPRIANWAGFELGSGEIINSVYPEDAAKFYSGK